MEVQLTAMDLEDIQLMWAKIWPALVDRGEGYTYTAFRNLVIEHAQVKALLTIGEGPANRVSLAPKDGGILVSFSA